VLRRQRPAEAIEGLSQRRDLDQPGSAHGRSGWQAIELTPIEFKLLAC